MSILENLTEMFEQNSPKIVFSFILLEKSKIANFFFVTIIFKLFFEKNLKIFYPIYIDEKSSAQSSAK